MKPDSHATIPAEAAPPTGRPSLESAIGSGIRMPLAALRAALESLRHELPEGGPHAARVELALGEVRRLGRNLQTLIDYSLPPAFKPLTCTLEELTRSALAALPEPQRGRVSVAVAAPDRHVHADALMVGRSVGLLLACALESCEEVLLRFASDHGALRVSVLGERTSCASAGGVCPCDPCGGDCNGLYLAVAEREALRMQGALVRRATRSGGLRFELTLPAVLHQEEAA